MDLIAPPASPPAVVTPTTATVAGGFTSKNGEWRPSYGARYGPLFAFPRLRQPIEVLTWLFSWPGYVAPWNAIYVGLVLLSIEFTQPPTAHFTVPSAAAASPFARAAATLLARNLALLWLIAGGWHLLLYTLRLQGDVRKYDPKPQLVGRAATERGFLFASQVYDNVFYSCASGVPIWTAFEVLYFWCLATGRLPAWAVIKTWSEAPVYNAAWLFCIPFWRELHFYLGHRLLHVKALYPHVHALHHKNSNPGPWSGLAMHPIEHVVYFSVVLIHFVVPSHPIHFLFNAQHTALTPSGGHHGYEGPIVNGLIPTGSYFHYLHHRYFECNYGEGTLPLDWLFGTFRDGLPNGEGSSLAGTEHGVAEGAKTK